MRAHQQNPERNKLPEGINEAALVGAIAVSGYPLQGEVARLLRAEFEVVEEWGSLTPTPKSIGALMYRRCVIWRVIRARA